MYTPVDVIHRISIMLNTILQKNGFLFGIISILCQILFIKLRYSHIYISFDNLRRIYSDIKAL
jgi:hypothetical protein